MKFKNETKEDVLMPVILDKNLPSSKLIIKDGETKEVPSQAIETARSYGLTPVEEKILVNENIESEESSISKVKVETKKIKKSKKKETN